MREWVVRGAREGFDNYADFPEEGELHKPLKAALEYAEAVTKRLNGEVEAGGMGVYDELPHPHLHAQCFLKTVMLTS